MAIPMIPETILRRIWQEQRFTRDHLSTADGRRVVILSSGTPNTDAGPDFLGARIAIGRIVYRGDVELHVSAEEWLAHKHDRDPHYNSVILHVVLSANPLSPPARTASRRIIPLLVLHPFLDEATYEAWTSAGENSRTHPLACSDVNDGVPASLISRWIEKLGRERIELKVRRFDERLKQLVDESQHVLCEPYPRYYGNPAEIPAPRRDYVKKDFVNRPLWEQLLYEGILEGLGYAKNQKPFLRLARSMRLQILRRFSLDDTPTMMALLFGAASLLPSSKTVNDSESRLYLARLKKRWRSLRPSFRGEVLHEGDWLFFRLRPQNFPTARLAALCFLLPKLFGDDAFRALMRLLKDDTLSTRERRNRLHELFSFTADGYWQNHYHFAPRRHGAQSEGSASAQPVIALGVSRINDIIVNTIVPIGLLYARVFRDAAVARHARSLLSSLPPLQDNAQTQVIRRDLIKEKVDLRTALQHQGAMQLYRCFCSPLRCAECSIGQRTPLGMKSEHSAVR